MAESLKTGHHERENPALVVERPILDGLGGILWQSCQGSAAQQISNKPRKLFYQLNH